jgi:hypothetical protein
MLPATLYIRIAECVAGLALIAAICFGVHLFLSHEQQIGYDRAVAEYQAKEVAAKDAARATEQKLYDQVQEARNAAAQRDQENRTLAGAALAASGGLRDTLADIRRRLPGDSGATAAHTADTLATVLSDCQDRYRDMAEKADRHANDARTLSESWPR